MVLRANEEMLSVVEVVNHGGRPLVAGGWYLNEDPKEARVFPGV